MLSIEVRTWRNTSRLLTTRTNPRRHSSPCLQGRSYRIERDSPCPLHGWSGGRGQMCLATEMTSKVCATDFYCGNLASAPLSSAYAKRGLSVREEGARAGRDCLPLATASVGLSAKGVKGVSFQRQAPGEENHVRTAYQLYACLQYSSSQRRQQRTALGRRRP